MFKRQRYIVRCFAILPNVTWACTILPNEAGLLPNVSRRAVLECSIERRILPARWHQVSNSAAINIAAESCERAMGLGLGRFNRQQASACRRTRYS